MSSSGPSLIARRRSPALLKLEQEGAIVSEWGYSENNRKAKFYKLTRAGRKQLAKDLNYTGDTNDSATMNIWLHKQVMQKLSENGGKVPADLLAH